MRALACAIAALVLLACVSPAHAAFPGANGKIAVDYAGIETINPDGTGATVLTSNGGRGEWSADGTKIAFNRCTPWPGSTCHIWTMNSDGTGQTQVTDGEGEDNPSWSPDGSRLVFTRSASEIWIVNADGTGETLIASGLSRMYDVPQWSPDGAKIVFSSNHRLGSWHRDIFTVRPDGTGLTRLTTTGTQEWPCEAYPDDTYGPDWSPDGSKIVYEYFQDRLDGECEGGVALHVMNADATGDHTIVGYWDTDYIEGPPSWSPDGTKVVFDASAVTYIANASCCGATPVTDGRPSDWQPVPSAETGGYPRPKGATKISRRWCRHSRRAARRTARTARRSPSAPAARPRPRRRASRPVAAEAAHPRCRRATSSSTRRSTRPARPTART
jgi:dipeptidyl aminopeptidase/acylaminoacyl peptidase